MSLADAMIDPDLFEEMNVVQPKSEPKLEMAEKEEDMDDLFGDGDDEVEHPQRQRSSSPAQSASADVTREGSEALSAAELQHRRNLEYEEDEGQEENVVELKHAVLSIPNIPIPRSSDGNNWVIRMPNFVKLDSKPFDRDTYVGPDQTDDTLSGNAAEVREKSMSIKLEVENTIRWRWKRIGPDPSNVERQSNSRIIRWSDGSMSLLLGKEIFDIHQAYEGAAQQTPRPSGPSLSQSNSQSQSFSQSQGPSGSQGGQVPPSRTNGLTYLVAQHKRPGILQAEAPITGHMTLRPTGMQSETHRMLARAVGQKHSKVARLRLAPDPTVAPELAQIEAMKAAASVRKPRQPRHRGPPGYGSPSDFRKKRSSFGGRRRGESVWESDEEPEAAFGDSEEEEEEGYGGGGGRRATRSGASGDGKRGAGEYQTDDFLVADSSEEGDEGDSDNGGRKKSKKRKTRDVDEEAGEEMDDLEAIDAKIAQQEEESRRRKKREHSGASGGDEEGGEKQERGEPMDVDMDVESEEEEDEEFTVRRTGGGSRRKRAIALDEEEEE